MQAWYLNENPYPFVPQHVLDSRGLRARQPAQQVLRSEARRRSLRGSARRVSAVRRPRHQRRLERAPRRHQLPLRRGAADPRRARAPDEERADPEPRHAHHRAQGSRARGRGVRDGRRDVARPARDRLREVGRLRDGVGQREPDRHRRPLLGGDRSHPQDAVASRRARSAGRGSTSRTATSTSGRGRGSSRTRRCGRRPAIPRRPRSSGGAASST